MAQRGGDQHGMWLTKAYSMSLCSQGTAWLLTQRRSNAPLQREQFCKLQAEIAMGCRVKWGVEDLPLDQCFRIASAAQRVQSICHLVGAPRSGKKTRFQAFRPAEAARA